MHGFTSSVHASTAKTRTRTHTHTNTHTHTHTRARARNCTCTAGQELAQEREPQVRDGFLVGLQTRCGKNFIILDSRRVLAPALKVLGPKHISNPDFAPF